MDKLDLKTENMKNKKKLIKSLLPYQESLKWYSSKAKEKMTPTPFAEIVT